MQIFIGGIGCFWDETEYQGIPGIISTECGYCGGSLHSKTLPYYDLVWEEETYRFENVPALVCAACDEVFFEASVDQAMDKALEHLDKPKRFAQIPILELPV